MVTCDSTTRKEIVYPGLGIDFIVELKSSEGKYLDTNALDLPDEPFESGDLRGQQAAFQLMAAVEKLPADQWDGWFIPVMQSAVKAAKERGEDSRQGAGIGMLHALDQLLAAYARSGLWRSVLMEQMDLYRSGLVEDHEKSLVDLDAFVASLTPTPSIDKPAPSRKARRTSQSSTGVAN